MDPTRRKLLLATVFGAGYVGLRAFASGLPPAFLLDRSIAHAKELPDPNFLILSTSGAGDPLNANAPGAYVDGAENNPSPALAPTEFSLGSMRTRAAKPWAELPEALRERLVFFHHRTYSNAHFEYERVMRGHGSFKGDAANGEEMLASVLAANVAKPLATVQSEPVAIGRNRVTLAGRALDIVRPGELRALFAEPEDIYGQLQDLRDKELNALYADLKSNGTLAQRRFLDRYALGRQQARQLGDELTELLTELPIDPESAGSPLDQVVAAAALVKLKVAPVVTITIPFGEDNHGDADLSDEATQTVAGVQAIGRLWDELVGHGLENQVTFGTFNVFGRTLRRTNGGRNHNQHHHCMVMFSPRARGGVIGGVEPLDKDFGATSIDSATGRSGGDIPPGRTLESAARTLASLQGVSAESIDAAIHGGKVVKAALV